MIKIEKEIRNTLYGGVFMTISGIFCLLMSIFNAYISNFGFIVMCITIVLGLYLAIKSIYMIGKVEQKDELIIYAEGKADQFGFSCAQAFIIFSYAICSFADTAGIAKVNINIIGCICMTMYGILIIIRNAYLLKLLHKDE